MNLIEMEETINVQKKYVSLHSRTRTEKISCHLAKPKFIYFNPDNFTKKTTVFVRWC